MLGSLHTAEANAIAPTHCAQNEHAGGPNDQVIHAENERHHHSERIPAEDEALSTQEEKQRREEMEAEEALRAFRAKQVLMFLIDLSRFPLTAWHHLTLIVP